MSASAIARQGVHEEPGDVAVHHRRPVRQLSPPTTPSTEFAFWIWLPRFRRHHGCPDCRQSFRTPGFLLRHLRREHPRWDLFCKGLELLRRGPVLTEGERRARRIAAVRDNWKDPAFRARNAAATRKTLETRWKDPAFRARHAAAVRDNWKDPAFRARNAAATRSAISERLRDEAQRIVDALAKRVPRRRPASAQRSK